MSLPEMCGRGKLDAIEAAALPEIVVIEGAGADAHERAPGRGGTDREPLRTGNLGAAVAVGKRTAFMDNADCYTTLTSSTSPRSSALRTA
jgi:hypothetical protein